MDLVHPRGRAAARLHPRGSGSPLLRNARRPAERFGRRGVRGALRGRHRHRRGGVGGAGPLDRRLVREGPLRTKTGRPSASSRRRSGTSASSHLAVRAAGALRSARSEGSARPARAPAGPGPLADRSRAGLLRRRRLGRSRRRLGLRSRRAGRSGERAPGAIVRDRRARTRRGDPPGDPGARPPRDRSDAARGDVARGPHARGPAAREPRGARRRRELATLSDERFGAESGHLGYWQPIEFCWRLRPGVYSSNRTIRNAFRCSSCTAHSATRRSSPR